MVDIESAPPTAEEIESQRRELTGLISSRERIWLALRCAGWLQAIPAVFAALYFVPAGDLAFYKIFGLCILASGAVCLLYGFRFISGVLSGVFLTPYAAFLGHKFGWEMVYLFQGVVGLCGPFVAVKVIAFLRDHLKPEELHNTLSGLGVMNGTDAPLILRAVRSNRVVAKYHEQVASQGRDLMRAEAQAIKAWIEGAGERSIAAAEQDALRALRQHGVVANI
jgi:hypothetical protein